MAILNGQGLRTHGFYLLAFLRVQAMDLLFGVGGEGEKGKASHYLMSQLAVVNGMTIIKISHFIFNEKKRNLVQIAYLVITSFSHKMLPNCY